MRSNRAQSESIGVVLLTGVVIVAIGGASAVVLTTVSGGVGAPSQFVDVDIDATTTNVTVEHRGGDPLAMSDSAVVVRGESSERRYGIDVANVTGDADQRFEPGERFERAHGISGDTATILVVDTAANEVLARASIDVRVPDGNRPPTAVSDVSPSPPDPGESATFDAGSTSDPDGSITNYTWSFGDGTTATGETVTHSYDTAGSYDVELTVTDDSGATDTVTETIEVTTARAPDEPSDVEPGLTAEYYEGTYTSLPDFDTATSKRVDRTDTFDIADRDRDDDFAFRFTGYVDVPERGNYTFYTESDDGSRLSIGDAVVVDNGGLHPPTEASGEIELQAGRHPISVTYFEHTGGETLDVRWSGPNVSKQSIPAANLSRDTTPLAAFDTDCAVLECSFAANGTATGDDAITDYEWAFGDGTTATGETVTHEYDSGGNYTVELTVVDDAGAEATVARNVTVEAPRSPTDPTDTTTGVAYSYYENGTVDDLGDLQRSAIVRNGTTDGIDLDPDHREENFGFRYTGYVTVPETGEYTFYTTSDDGSRLFVGDERVVNNDGEHSAITESGSIALEAGTHPITVTYFEHEVDQALSVEYEGPGVDRQVIPTANLSRDRERARWASAGDWDETVSETGVVHENYGDRRAAAVELGYPTVGRWGPAPLAFWPLDEDSGTTATDVAGSNDGTVTGADIGRSGTVGTTAYDFDGSDDYVNGATDLAPLRETGSLSFWIRTTQTGDDTMYQAPGVTGVESAGDDNDVFWGWLDSNGQIGIQSGDDPGAQSTTSVNDGGWHHVVLTRDSNSGEVRVYVDGNREDTVTSRTGAVTNTFSSIGRVEDTGGSPEYFDGRLDEVAVYDRVLTDGEVETLDDAGSRGSLTTDSTTFDHAVSPADLSLTNVSANRPAGTTVTVTVRSDPDGDGTFEEVSDSIALDGSGEYDVTGLASDSRRYRLGIELSTTDPTLSPTVETVELAG